MGATVLAGDTNRPPQLHEDGCQPTSMDVLQCDRHLGCPARCLQAPQARRLACSRACVAPPAEVRKAWLGARIRPFSYPCSEHRTGTQHAKPTKCSSLELGGLLVPACSYQGSWSRSVAWSPSSMQCQQTKRQGKSQHLSDRSMWGIPAVPDTHALRGTSGCPRQIFPMTASSTMSLRLASWRTTATYLQLKRAGCSL